MPPTMKLSPRYITKSSSPRKSLATSTACASPSGWLLPDVGGADPERGAVADRLLDRGRGIADHEADIGDPGVGDRLQAVEEDRLVRHREQLLGGGVGDRAQPRPGPSRQDQRLSSPGKYTVAHVGGGAQFVYCAA